MKLKFECKTKEEREAARQFLDWLSGQGEQDYWQWQDCRDEPVTITRFDYTEKFEVTCSIEPSEDVA